MTARHPEPGSGTAAGPQVPRAVRPCGDCPWRRDAPPGKFSAERYDALSSTIGAPGAEAPLNAPLFACHNTDERQAKACAGWLAVAGHQHLGVRYAVLIGRLSAEALGPAPGWPELYASYVEMVGAQAAASGGRP